MCLKNLKKLFLLDVFMLLALPLASESQNVNQEQLLQKQIVQSQNSTTELSSSNQTSQIELQNVNCSESNLNQSEITSMTAYQLLDNLEARQTKLSTRIMTLQQSSKNLESELLTMRIELNSSIELCEQLRTALKSNKEDTSTIIEELGNLQEQITQLETNLQLITQKRDNWRLATFIGIPVSICLSILGTLIATR